MIKIHKKGKELAQIELDVINNARKKAFNSKKVIDPIADDEEGKKDFFLVENEEKFVSIGCLEAVTVKVNTFQFNILGISRIIAIEEGKGYGRAVMDSIRNYLVENDKIGMGFCNPSKSMFYSKCGYTIMPNAQNNFEYFDKAGKLVPSNYAVGDVVIWDNKSQIYSIWDNNKDTKFRISKPHW